MNNKTKFDNKYIGFSFLKIPKQQVNYFPMLRHHYFFNYIAYIWKKYKFQ